MCVLFFLFSFIILFTSLVILINFSTILPFCFSLSVFLLFFCLFSSSR